MNKQAMIAYVMESINVTKEQAFKLLRDKECGILCYRQVYGDNASFWWSCDWVEGFTTKVKQSIRTIIMKGN